MFILASQSPRRQALLQRIMTDFKVIPADIDESDIPLQAPADYVEALAIKKAQTLAQIHKNATILSADTVISYQQTIFGKPKDYQEAKKMLTQLSGQKHQVYTGVCLYHQGQFHQKVVKTDVCFLPLSNTQITNYLEMGEWTDKAGGYGIQGAGALLVSGICGDFYNIVGLPISTVKLMIDEVIK